MKIETLETNKPTALAPEPTKADKFTEFYAKLFSEGWQNSSMSKSDFFDALRAEAQRLDILQGHGSRDG